MKQSDRPVILNGTLGNDMGIRIGADTDNIWLEEKEDDGNGNITWKKISGSDVAWQDLQDLQNPSNQQIRKWDGEGGKDVDGNADVSDQKEYDYQYKSANGDYDVAFYLKLLDETSIDSVIRGLNEAEMIRGLDITSDQAGLLNDALLPSKPEAVLSGKIRSQSTLLTVGQEARLGRNFDQQTWDYAPSQLEYDADKNQFLLNYEEVPQTTPSTNALEYRSKQTTNLTDVKKVISNYRTYLVAKSVQKLFGSSNLNATTLTELLGAGKVTQDGYLSEDITIPANAICTQGAGSYEGLTLNTTYPGAHIDFSEMGTKYQIYDILGMGFNSNCMTCTNHYSVMFTFGDSNGKGYTIDSEQVGSDRHYTMYVDIETMMQKGITDGDAFTKELVKILDGANLETGLGGEKSDQNNSLDFHFSQYAAADGVLYVCDNRRGDHYFQEDNRKKATFDDSAYRVNHLNINFTLQDVSNSANKMDMEYTYDLTKTDNPLVVPVAVADLVPDSNGDYVKVAGRVVRFDSNNPAHRTLQRYSIEKKIGYQDENGGYVQKPDGTFEVYSATNPAHQGRPRYKMLKTDGNSNISKENWESFYDAIMQDIADSTKIQLSSDDYAWMNYHVSENESSAVVSTFKFEVEDTKGFWIQTGANSMHGINLDWDGFNSYTLGIGSGNVYNSQNAGFLIDRTDSAIEIISDIRSTFGTYINRLQHAWAYDENTAENVQAAESKIRDTDMAKAMLENAKLDILGQAGISMIAQANRINQGVVQLLR